MSGEPGSVSVDTTFVAFGERRIGVAGEPRAVLVRNDTAQPVRLKPATIEGPHRGDFVLRDGCRGGALDGRALCRLEIAFTPRDIGGRSATLTLDGPDPDRPLTVALSGTGTTPVVDVAGSLAFPGQEVGTTSAPRNLTLRNSGTAPANVVVAGPSGPHAGDFTLGNGCPRDLAPDASCSVDVRFRPADTGARRATLTITHDAPGSPLVIPLSGNGTPPPPPPEADVAVAWRDREALETSSWYWEEIVAVTNNGPGTATGVRLSVNGYVVFRSTTRGNCSGGNSIEDNPSLAPMTCTIGSMPPGETVEVRVRREDRSSMATVTSGEDRRQENNKSESDYLGGEVG